MKIGSFNVGMTLFVAALFVLLTPGVVVSLPAKATLLQKAAVHGLLFAVVYHYTHKTVWSLVQGFTNGPPAALPVAAAVACGAGTKLVNGKCVAA